MITPHQTLIVLNTYIIFAGNPKQAGKIFYNYLFEIAPELKPMFKGDIDTQASKLMRMVGTGVKTLHKPELFNKVLSDLGKRHVNYGVKPEHYTAVGEALIHVVQSQLQDGFTPEVEDAWRAVFDELARVSIEGME